MKKCAVWVALPTAQTTESHPVTGNGSWLASYSTRPTSWCSCSRLSWARRSESVSCSRVMLQANRSRVCCSTRPASGGQIAHSCAVRRRWTIRSAYHAPRPARPRPAHRAPRPSAGRRARAVPLDPGRPGDRPGPAAAARVDRRGDRLRTGHRPRGRRSARVRVRHPRDRPGRPRPARARARGDADDPRGLRDHRHRRRALQGRRHLTQRSAGDPARTEPVAVRGPYDERGRARHRGRAAGAPAARAVGRGARRPGSGVPLAAETP